MSCDHPCRLAETCEADRPDEADDDEVRALPSAEALLAGTLALMTGVVERAALSQPLTGHGQSLMMAAKVRSNLFFLSGHPQVSAGFRMTLERLRQHWDRLAEARAEPSRDAAPSATEAARRLWHAAPEQVQ
ncbi:MAG TPA: hypothetical protein VFR90_15100 [Methylibium sp.]|uniref:hypothetical protein n=1 Tax=Methylibium sp. TaxID=2067992 RepID=UPI002DBDF47F|nr:hypothetical protein [Methylibium sp.]HEU4460447.1 hypothetical protein [Methylibium sp.]